MGGDTALDTGTRIDTEIQTERHSMEGDTALDTDRDIETQTQTERHRHRQHGR